jgi:diguanylate cyclase (GGDEF)-like protein
MSQVEQLKISDQLPSPRGVALSILELSRRDNVTLGEIARVVQTDPALSSRLIKLANTGSRISRPVVSLQEAVVRQGMSTVRQLALGFSLLDQYRSGTCASFDYPAYWSHSLLMGLTMQALGQHVRVAAPDELFVCGLFAQVGRLALATAYSAEYDTVLQQYRADLTQSLAALERAALETDHTELGSVMMAEWGIPKPFTEPLAVYEDTESLSYPNDSRSESLIRMLRLSHMLADLSLAEESRRPKLAHAWVEAAAQLDFKAEQAASFIDEVIVSWKEWGDLLKIPVSTLPPFAEIEQGDSEPHDNETPLRIVVADSNAFSRRKIMSLLVENSAHIVYPADNGNAALALAMEVLPHVIIAHFNLPGLDGPELCHALRETEEGRRMHILLMSDEHGEEQLTRAYEVGADGYAPGSISSAGLRTRLSAAQRFVQLQNAWERDRAQLRQIAAELAVANRRLANAALTDLLTGLPNRRSAMDQLDQAWSGALRANQPLAVMVIDVDHFKHINDTYGHATGDHVLREVADVLRKSARRGDSVCRIGGEEFLVICPNTDLKAAVLSAERLRATLANHPVTIGAGQGRVTISVGVSSRHDNTPDTDALVRMADQALYSAKQAGRNRISAH